MVQQVPSLVRPVQVSDGAAIGAELKLPDPRRLLVVSIIVIALLALSVIAAAWYAVQSVDQLAEDTETARARVALQVVLADGARPSAAIAGRLAHDFALNDARFVTGTDAKPEELTLAVPGSDAHLAWTPRRFGTELSYQLVPIRLLSSALFLSGITFVLMRLYRLTRELEARRRAAQELASRDALTGLCNRLGFDRTLAQVTGSPALLYLDLDGFKQVNDSFGHGAGDDLLRIVAERLASLAREGDVVARIGGDEFAILRGAPVSRAELAELAADIGLALSEPVRLGATLLQIGASIGIAMGSEYADDHALLVRAADAALYRAKALPGHAFVFADTPQVADAA